MKKITLGHVALNTAPHGAWAAYTFSIITSIGIKNIIISFFILFFSIINI